MGGRRQKGKRRAARIGTKRQMGSVNSLPLFAGRGGCAVWAHGGRGGGLIGRVTGPGSGNAREGRLLLFVVVAAAAVTAAITCIPRLRLRIRPLPLRRRRRRAIRIIYGC